MTILTNEPIRLFKDTDNWDGKLVANFRNLEFALEDITSLIGEVDARGRLVNNRGFNIGRMQLYPYINLSNTDLVQNFLVLEPRFSGEEAGFWIHPYTIDSGESQIVLSEDVNLQTGSALKLEASALDGTVSISSIFLGTVGTPQPLVFNVTNLTGSTDALTEAMRIDTNYDVQIGDTGTILTSTERLHITKDGGASGASAVVIENSNSTGGQSKSAQLVLASNNSAKWSIETDIGRAGTHNFGIRDLTVNKPRMWFDASYGHLYIGRDTDNTIVSAESGTRVLSLEAPTNSRLLLRTTLDPAVASSGDPYTVQVAFGQDLGVGGVIQSGSGQQSWLLIHHLTDTHSAQLTFGAGHIDISHTYSSVRSASTSFWQRGLVVGDAHTGLALGSISPAFSAYGTCLLINDNQPRILFQDLDQLTATQHLNGEGLFTIDCGGDVMAFKRSTTTDSWVSADMLVLNSGGVKQVGASANTQGDILYFNGSNWVALGYGTSGQFLKTQGIGANPIWADEAGVGDMLKSVYDTDNDGIVDNSELVGGKAETEFALLAGRAGGQILYGGTATTEELHLYDNPTNNNGVKIYQNGLGDKHVELLINSGSYFRVTHANTGEDYAFAGVPMIIRTSGASFPVASAILELFSTTQGFLPPRMTTAQRDLIGTPVAGLIIYNATTNELNEYNGSGWVALLPTALASAKLFVGNGSGIATPVTLSGDITNDNAGVTVIGNDKVTYAKMQNVSTNNRLLGRATAGAGDAEEITLGTNLSISGTTLNATGGGVTDHGALTGLADDDHTQYALLLGRASGQTLIGGNATNQALQLKSNSIDSGASFIHLHRYGIGIKTTDIETWYSGFDAIESHSNSIILGNSAEPRKMYLTSNVYYSTDWKYKTTAAASMIKLQNNTITYYSALSGTIDTTITWTTMGDFDGTRLRLGKGLQFNGVSTSVDDVNTLHVDSTARALVVSCGITTSFGASYGPAIGGKGNTYSAIANQRGNWYFNAGNPTTPNIQEGRIIMRTGADVDRFELTKDGNITIGSTLSAGTDYSGGGIGCLTQLLANTNPSSSPVNAYIQYGADIVAGNTAPHFRTENGSIIKLFKSSAYTPTNVTTDRSFDANATSIDELADVLGTLIVDLQATGLIG